MSDERAIELIEYRKNFDLSQAKLAADIGVTANTVARWEREEVQIPEPAWRLFQFLRDSTTQERVRLVTFRLTGEHYSADFDHFWKIYPKKRRGPYGQKPKAFAEWTKLNPDTTTCLKIGHDLALRSSFGRAFERWPTIRNYLKSRAWE